MTAPAASFSADLRALLRRLKLGQALDTLHERLALAAQHHLGRAEFLEQVLSDEVQCRDSTSAAVGPGPPTSTQDYVDFVLPRRGGQV